MPCFTYEAQWSTYYLPGIPTGKQCPGATRTQFACWGKIPNPQDQDFVLAAHLKNASLSAQNKIVSTLTEFAMFEKSIAYECCYMI